MFERVQIIGSSELFFPPATDGCIEDRLKMPLGPSAGRSLHTRLLQQHFCTCCFIENFGKRVYPFTLNPSQMRVDDCNGKFFFGGGGVLKYLQNFQRNIYQEITLYARVTSFKYKNKVIQKRLTSITVALNRIKSDGVASVNQ